MNTEDVCSKIAGQRDAWFFLSFTFCASMSFHWRLLQGWAEGDPRGAVVPGPQRLPDRIHLQDPPNPLRLPPSHFRNLLHNHKAACGEA